jgi:hypothetical protein
MPIVFIAPCIHCLLMMPGLFPCRYPTSVRGTGRQRGRTPSSPSSVPQHHHGLQDVTAARSFSFSACAHCAFVQVWFSGWC